MFIIFHRIEMKRDEVCIIEKSKLLSSNNFNSLNNSNKVIKIVTGDSTIINHLATCRESVVN